MRTTLLSQKLLPFAAALLVAVTFSSCTDETIVYRDRAPFNPPPDAASGFLGYYDATARQTTCGNCHAEKQATWVETKHANAAHTLDINDHAQDFCYSCHTVTSNGNPATAPAGWDVVKDSVYRDVQCESCHGPGLEHIEGVGQGNITLRPLASVQGVGRAVCGDCHSGDHHPFLDQWELSRHAIANSRGNNSSCAPCHGSRGRLAAWDTDANYVELGTSDILPVATCAVCHDPHGSTNEHMLRRSPGTTDPEQNLCMGCHLRRVEPGPSSSRGNQPHGVQGGVLLGYAGWRPPGFVYDTARIYGSHATEANPNLCAGCHVYRFTATDQATGDFEFESVGHQFQATPCVDANGAPTGERDCEYTAEARNWGACVASGCHNSEAVAANAWVSSKASLEALADVLWNDLNHNEDIDPFPTDGGMLPRILLNAPGDLNPRDETISAADGAEFNVRTCGVGLEEHEDGSYGAHNKFLCQALLAQSATYLRTIYGFLPAPPAELQSVMDMWATGVPTGEKGQPIIKREPRPVLNHE